jgi:tyrosyl-tRNA synthetase
MPTRSNRIRATACGGTWRRRGPVGRESLALPRMDPEARTELLAAPPSAADGPGEAAAWLTRNAVDCLPDGELERKLELGRPLRVKLGIDPTAPDIHLGFTVVLQKLREFQDLGHTVVLIVGDYTARVGDPSGRSSTRPVLSPAEIDANAETFREQALKVLDPERLEVRFNGEWLDMSMEDLFRLARIPTVAQLLERDDFAKRFAAHEPISVLELLYPLLQGYDSVAIRADVELGGTDQKFNLLLGRDIQRAYGVPEQVILTLPLLTGTDGEQKMSKSYGNYIGVTDPPAEMYGKTLSIPDTSLASWYELLLGSGPPPELGPRDAKRALARALVARFHGEAAAAAAQAEFDRVHIQHQAPEDMPTVSWSPDGHDVHLPALLAHAFGISTSEARRTLAQGGVKLDGEPVAGNALDLPAAAVDGKVLQLGRRRFARVRVVPPG